MSKAGKVVVFIIVAFVILLLATLLKEAGAGAVLSVGAFAIYMLYQAMFKKNHPIEDDNKENEITLKK